MAKLSPEEIESEICRAMSGPPTNFADEMDDARDAVIEETKELFPAMERSIEEIAAKAAKAQREEAIASLMTEQEHHLMALTAELANGMRALCQDDDNDWRECAQDIHRIQDRILAQAAARAFPTRYRLLGGTVLIDHAEEEGD